jgi:lipoprotein Spr
MAEFHRKSTETTNMGSFFCNLSSFLSTNTDADSISKDVNLKNKVKKRNFAPMLFFKHLFFRLFTFFGILFCSSLNGQNLMDTENGGVSLRFIDEIEITPKKLKKTGSIWRGEGTSVYPSTSEKPEIFQQPKSQIDIENASALKFKYALLLDIEVENLPIDDEWINFLQHWIGTRYVYGGQSLTGTDCSGFSRNLYQKILGIQLPRTSEDQAISCGSLFKDSIQTGDLVFFKNGSRISHVGVYLTNGRFVHASSSQGVTISQLKEPYYQKRFWGAGRIQVNSTFPDTAHNMKDEP